MPYRRLPNTDNARIKALRTALDKNKASYGESAIKNMDILTLESVLRRFESAQYQYKESLETQAEANRRFQKHIKNAKLYISHFIQVLNFCVIRGEIKKEYKKLYGLDPANYSVPDLNNNDSILEWGEKIISGEQARKSQGESPIYNPTIARVNVAFSQFKDAYFTQKTYQNTTNRQLKLLSEQRETIDQILISLWNQIENAFSYLPNSERIERCKEYGVVYYLRKEEKELSENH